MENVDDGFIDSLIDAVNLVLHFGDFFLLVWAQDF